jgi:hypothetical protein
MTEHEAENLLAKDCKPSEGLISYLHQRLKLSRQMDKMDAAGEDFSPEINAQDRSLRTKKVRVLDDIIFQAMADLTFFFESIAAHPELLVIFDSDIKELLGVRHEGSQEYGFMLRRLLRSILIIEEERDIGGVRDIGKVRDKDRLNDKQDDYRLRLNHILQGIVFDKARPYIVDTFDLREVQHVLKEDFSRAWGWTGTLSYGIDERNEGTPRRTFQYDFNKLLK